MSDEEKGRNPEMEEKKETIKLEFDDRLFELLSKDLYRDSMSFLRELTQNSADAGATEITWEVDFDKQTLTEIDNGKGMDYEFVKEDWKKVGKAFKVGDNIGMYGIGRLSLWQVAEKVFIRTNDVEIHWDSLTQYDIIHKDQKIKGLILTVKFKPEHKYSLDEGSIRQYLEENTNLEKISIKVNGREVTRKSQEYTFKAEIEDELATVYFKAPETYDDEILVFEKGLLVKSVYNSNISAMVDFGKTVKTLSRESLTIPDGEVQKICMNALKKILMEKLDNPELRPLFFDELKKYAKSIAYLAYYYNEEDLAKRLPMGEKLLSEYKGFYYSKESILVERAKEKNINVLVIETIHEEACCNLVGLKTLEYIRDKLARKFFVRKTDNAKGKRILMDCAGFMEYLTTIMGKIPRIVSKGRIIKTERLTLLEERFNNSGNSLDSELRAIGSGEIRYAFGNLAFGEANDKCVVAWQSGGYIVLNLNNDLVQTLIETERLDLIQETLIHEFTHLLGYHYHDEEFVCAYNTIFHTYLKDRANSSVVFKTNAQINAIGKKYRQGSLKIPSNALKKLDLKKGQKVTILLEKEEESEEKTQENLGENKETDLSSLSP
jgi:predicted DNA-binding antitoxin AbrB/MazE fold protein